MTVSRGVFNLGEHLKGFFSILRRACHIGQLSILNKSYNSHKILISNNNDGMLIKNMQNLLVQTVLKKYELFGCVFRMVDEAKEVYSQR